MHELQDYAISTYPSQTDRLSKLLLRLPALRLLPAAIMEELFFAGLIGNVQIDNIIPYMLRMEGGEYAGGGGGASAAESSLLATQLLSAAAVQGGGDGVTHEEGRAAAASVTVTVSE